MASEGDKVAEKYLDYWLEVNAAGIATVSVSYDPELIVIGGSVALNNWDFFIEGIKKKVKGKIRVAEPTFEKASFGDDEVLMGAIAIARQPPASLKAFGYPRSK